MAPKSRSSRRPPRPPQAGAGWWEDHERAVATLKNVSTSYSRELRSTMSRLGELISNRHWLSDGNYKEALIRRQLIGKLPRHFEVGTGFVMTMAHTNKLISSQIDILIWDSSRYSPLFRDGEFVVIPPEACRGAIEVKGRLTHKEFRDALAKLDSLSQFMEYTRRESNIYKAIIAFDSADEIKFPSSVFNRLVRHYNDTPMSLSKRLWWMRTAATIEAYPPPRHVERQYWLDWESHHQPPTQLPWINAIGVLNKGLVSLDVWRVNGELCPHWTAYATVDGNDDDTYGRLQADLLMNLLSGNNHNQFVLSHTGMRNVNFATQPDVWPGKSSLILPVHRTADIHNICDMPTDVFRVHRDRIYRPPNSPK